MSRSLAFGILAASFLLSVTVLAAPTVSTISPTTGSTVSTLTSISITFSEAVSGVDAGDLQINAENAAGVTGSGAGPYVFTFTQPPAGLVSASFDFDHGIAGTAGTGAFVQGSGWTYTLTDAIAPTVGRIITSVAGQELNDITPAPGSTVGTLTQAEIVFSEPVTGVDAADLLINGAAATTVTGTDAGPYLFTFTQPAAGTVNFTWAATPGILDAVGNVFAGGSPWSVTLLAGAPQTIAITEILAGNTGGLLDEDSETSDWIELTNTGATTVNLTGWSLSDDADHPSGWVLPARSLAAGARLMVFASAKDRKPAAANLHANFSLKLNGGYLGLYNAASPRVAVSEYKPYPSQRYTYSYGLLLNTTTQRYFAAPTPNAANAATGLTDLLQPPSASVSRGVFKDSFPLILSSSDPTATVRYTTDGSEPAVTSTIWPGQLTISSTTIIRAAAFAANKVPSTSITETYLWLDQVLTQPEPPYFTAATPANPALPTVGTATFPISWGSSGTGAFPGKITNLATNVIPADYGMDAEIYNNAALYDDTGAVNAATGKTNLTRIKQGMRDLPALSIVMKMDDMFGTSGLYLNPTLKGTTYEKACSVELIMPDGSSGVATTCGIRIHGNGSRGQASQPKHGFKLNFKGAFGASSLKYQLFPDLPADEFDDIILRADYNGSWTHSDPAQRTKGVRIRDAFSKETFRDMGRDAGHNRFVNLFINGIYWGTYDPTEQENAGFAATHFGGSDTSYDVVEQGGLKSGTLTAYNAMIAIASPITNANYQLMKQYLDMPWFIDYMLLHFYLGHQDWGDDPNKNWYAVRNKNNGLFRYIPWDLENVVWSETVDRTQVASPPSGLHTKLVTCPQYLLDFADRIHRHMIAPGGVLEPAPGVARWQKWRAVMNNALACESARWGDYRRDVHSYNGTPYDLYTWNVTAITESNRVVNTWFPTRTNNVLTQLRARTLYPTLNAPQFVNNATSAVTGDAQVAAGYVLKMQLTTPVPSGTTSAGTIYYTIDGSDPRVYFDTTGQRTASALTYSAPITINTSTVVKARALNGTVWSALMEATFTVGSPVPSVRITELNYHPSAAQGGDAAEFIEIQNTGTLSVDLTGWSFEGVNFLFPAALIIGPGGRLVIASNTNPVVFASQYPSVSTVGTFSGSLDNNGERISLMDRQGRVVDAVEYGDSSPWPVAADGNGFSLERVETAADSQSPSNWHASTALKGTPGTVNSTVASTGITISEFLAVSTGSYQFAGAPAGFVELTNASVSDVNLTGWKLSANGTTVTLSGVTVTAGGGRLVIPCATGLPLNGGSFTAALPASAARIDLVNPAKVTIDTVRYGPQIADRSFSRSGNAWILGTPTPGSTTAAVTVGLVGALRINEIFSNPIPGEDDWMELFNTNATNPVILTGVSVTTTGSTIAPVVTPAAIAPSGWARLICNSGGKSGDTVLTQLPAAGSTLTLVGLDGLSVDSIAYAAQAQGVSSGRVPDGTGTPLTVLTYPSPGLTNATASGAAPVLNEVMAINRSTNAPWAHRPAWVELRNPTAGALSLTGWQLRSIGKSSVVTTWTVPSGVTLAASGFLAVWCDSAEPVSTTAAVSMNAGLAIDGNYDVWGIELIRPDGRLADRITWGIQMADVSIGRDTDTVWKLLSSPTRGLANAAAATLGDPLAVRLNEWLAASAGVGEFVEIYNPGASAVALGGLWLSDEPSETGRRKWQVPALSFLSSHGFAVFSPDSGTANPSRISFELAADGESLLLCQNNATTSAVDTLTFGQQPTTGNTTGRLPDGSATVSAMTATPGSSNGAQLAGPVFTLNPQSQILRAGSPLTLSVLAPAATAFQWSLNATPVGGATDASLIFPAATALQSGTWLCTATGPGGTSTSLSATVTILYNYTAFAAEYGLQGGNEDADSDGLSNYAEFLAGSNPLVPASSAADNAIRPTGLRENISGVSLLSMDLTLSGNSAWNKLSGELSPNLALGSWTITDPASSQILSTNPDGTQRIRFRFPTPLAAPRQFLRFRLDP